MSINMTQALVFETDDLQSFGKLLEPVSQILFETKSGKYKPKVILKPPSYWEDGQYEDYDHHSAQPMMLPIMDTETDVLLVEPCATFGGATQLKVVDNAATLDEAARKACAKRQKPLPKRQWICTIENYVEQRDFKRGEYVSPKNHQELVGVVLELCSNVDKEKFRHDFADIEDRYFDGSVGVGYRMQWRPNGGWNVLDISMVHAYYGK